MLACLHAFNIVAVSEVLDNCGWFQCQFIRMRIIEGLLDGFLCCQVQINWWGRQSGAFINSNMNIIKINWILYLCLVRWMLIVVVWCVVRTRTKMHDVLEENRSIWPIRQLEIFALHGTESKWLRIVLSA